MPDRWEYDIAYDTTWIDGDGVNGNTIIPNASGSQTYTVFVEDEFNCVYSEDFNVNVMPMPTVNITPDRTQLCDGGTTQLTASPAGASSYSWSVEPAGEAIQAVQAPSVTPPVTSTYTVEVRTSNGCTGRATAVVEIGDAPPITLSARETLICKGSSTELTVDPNDLNDANHTWTWSASNGSPAPTTAAPVIVTPTATTTYIVTVKDNIGCRSIDSVTVTVKDPPTLEHVTTSGEASQKICQGSPIAPIEYKHGGGATGTNVSWSWTGTTNSSTPPNGISVGTTGDITTISGTPTMADIYNYTIETIGDYSPCGPTILTGIITVKEPPTLRLQSGSTTQTVCKSSPIAAISYEHGGGATGTSVSWTGTTNSSTPPAGISVGTTGDITTISGAPTTAGTYNYTIQTTGGYDPCDGRELSGQLTVKEPPTLQLQNGSYMQAICDGTEISTIVYGWGGGANDVNITGIPTSFQNKDITTQKLTISGQLGANTYAYTVNTVGNYAPCPSVIVHDTIRVYSNPAVEISPINGDICPGSNLELTGTVTTPTIGDYRFNWSGDLHPTPATTTQAEAANVVTASIPMSCGQNYTVKLSIEDGHGCTANAADIVVRANDTERPTMGGNLQDLNITACSVDAAPPMTTSRELAGLLQLSDNCTTVLDSLRVSNTDIITQGECPKIERRYIVSDLCGNSDTAMQMIYIRPGDFSVPASTSAVVNCFADTVRPTPPDVVDACGNSLIPTGPAISQTGNNCEGTKSYTWTYTDCAGHSHTWTHTFVISLPDFSVPDNVVQTVLAVQEAVPPTPPIVTDACGNLIIPNRQPVGGNYVSCSGTMIYTYTFTDCAGHSHDWTYVYNIVPDSISFTITGNDIPCFGQQNGSIDISDISGGTAPYSFTWDNGMSTGNITDLGPGIYNVTISDLNGCTTTATYSISQPTRLDLVAQVDNVTCHGGNDGRIGTIVTGGTPPYSYAWNNGQVGSSISELPIGSYVLNVTDSAGCRYPTQTYTITQPTRLDTRYSIQNVACNGQKSGKISVNGTGGTPPYTYRWSNRATAPQISNIGAGVYVVTVADANGCLDTTSLTVIEPAKLEVTYSATPPSCIGNNNGHVEFDITGGTAPYIITWDNGIAPIDTLTGLFGGLYHVTVTDANNCEHRLTPITLTDIQVDCITIPNAFTPNGDGINDTWLIDGIGMFPKARISVYNRWGQQVFKCTGNDEPWDGKYHGKNVPTGTYLYVIELFNGEDPYTGTVSVVQ